MIQIMVYYYYLLHLYVPTGKRNQVVRPNVDRNFQAACRIGYTYVKYVVQKKNYNKKQQQTSEHKSSYALDEKVSSHCCAKQSTSFVAPTCSIKENLAMHCREVY